MSFEKELNNQLNLPKRLDDQKAEEKIKETVNFKLLEEEIKTPDLLKKEQVWTEKMNLETKKGGVSAIIKTLSRLVLELKETLTDYDTILSDDIHGRPVSLFLKKIIDQQRKKIGKEGASIYFLASGRNRSFAQDSAIEDFVAFKKEKLGKALLVTELINEGGSMARLTDILVRHNIDFEVAAVQINKYFKDDYDQILLERLRYGSMYGDAGAILHQLPGLGIRKDKYSDLPHPILSDEERGPVIQLRKDIDTLAKELSKLVE